MKSHLAIVLACAMIAGCGNKSETKSETKSEPKTAAPAPPMVAKDAPPVVVVPPPAPPNAVDDGKQRPAPGQAGDHSSPAFKGGGKVDPKK